MSYKTIVVHLDVEARRAERLELACGLATGFDAHLVGLFALADMRVPFAFGGTAGALLLAEERWRADIAGEAERQFRDTVARRGVAKAEWRRSTRDALAAVQLSARYADLVVIGQHEDGRPAPEERLPPYFVPELVLSAGRPVLLVPYAGRFSSIGSRVLVAWNASREAARAVRDALPLLQRAKKVEIVAFDPDRGSDHGELPGADVALYLARHGVKATAAQQSAGIDVGEQILSRAADADADLIVMGAYGQSRVRELVLGGATRTVLRSMTVPVLMSH